MQCNAERTSSQNTSFMKALVDMMKKRSVALFGVLSVAVAIGIVAFVTWLQQNPANQAKRSFTYIVNAGSGTVSVVDLSSLEVVDTISVGAKASHGIGITPDQKYLYVGYQNAEGNENGIAVIDTTTRNTVSRIPLDGWAHGIDISRSGKYLYVDVPSTNSAYAIDTSSNTIGYKIGLAGSGHMDLSSDDRYLYLTDINGNLTHIVDTVKNSMIVDVPSGAIPNEPVVTPDGKYLFVANFGSSDVTVIRLSDYQVIKTIQAGQGTHGIAVTPDGKYVWTANRKSGDVAVIDTGALRVVRIIPTGNWTNHVAFTEDGKYALATSGGTGADVGTVSIIDTSEYRVIKILKLGKDPHEISLEDQKPFRNLSPAIENAFQYTKNDGGQGGVTAEATLLTPEYFKSIGKQAEASRYDFGRYIIFKLSLDTHSVDLSAYKPEISTILRNNTGNQLQAIQWLPESNDSHHRSGVLMFSRDGAGLLEAKYIELVVKDVAGIKERVLRWNTPIPGLT